MKVCVIKGMRYEILEPVGMILVSVSSGCTLANVKPAVIAYGEIELCRA